MKTKLIRRALPYLAIQLGLVFLAGCASQEKPKSKARSLDQLPVGIRQAFQARFPNAKDPEWKIKSDQNYEAEFTLQGTEIAAKFDSTGKWLETESAIPPAKLPQAVRDIAASQFQAYKVVETQSVERWNDARQIYELHFESAAQIVKAQFNADGTILNQSAKPRLNKAKE